MSEPMTMDQKWYAVYTKTREEERAEANLRAGGMKTLMPRIKERSSRRIAGKETIKFLFPRYIFARFNSDSELHKVNYTRGVCGVVRFGDMPCPVDDVIIDTIFSQIGSEGFITFDDSYRRGDKVTIKDGPFSQMTGTVDRELTDGDRLIVLLSSVSYQSRIMIQKALVQRVAFGH